MIVNNAPQLIVQSATDIRSFALLERSEWSIGREPSNLIQILDRFSSRFHAVVGVVGERHIYFRDLNSRNGSTLDGQRVTEPVLLKHGDRVMIGNTALVLKHNYLTTAHGLPPAAQRQALMFHASAIQGKIWQEILLSQTIDVIWEVPGANLQQAIGLRAAANLLPPLLILDIKATKEEIYGLSHWCRLQRLSVEILLIDSSRSYIPDGEQAYVKTLGFQDFMPALPVGQLCTRYQYIVQKTLNILTAFQAKDLSPALLLTSLRDLDQLLGKTPGIVSTPSQAAQDEINAEDLTSLAVDPRKLQERSLR